MSRRKVKARRSKAKKERGRSKPKPVKAKKPKPAPPEPVAPVMPGPEPEAPPEPAPEPAPKPGRHYSIRKGIKVLVYSLGGWVVALGMLAFAAVALHEDVPVAYIVLAQIPMAAILGGLHNYIEHKGKEVGVSPPEVMAIPGGVIQ